MDSIYTKFGAELYDQSTEGLEHEIEFYVEEAEKSGSPVLELGCGTGRITVPVAESGIEITGLELSSDMLEVAERKVDKLPPEVGRRIELVQGDMRDFSLDRKFNLIFIPFRSFQHVLTSEEQRRSLLCIRDHLADDGRLIIEIFDPRLDLIVSHSGNLCGAVKKYREFRHPDSGNRVVIWESRKVQLADQIIDEDWIFEEYDDAGKSISRILTNFKIRYIFRWEMEYLLELCSYKPVALYGDFKRGAFKHGVEQIWVGVKK